jgi:tRNA-dihydrouridine synthase B
MADAAQIVERMGADIVDVNMGCPVPKIAKHHAGCSLMREPEHAAAVVEAMVRAVRIPVTVKMRAGWNEREINAPRLARMVEDAGAAAVAVHGRTAAQSYRGESDWSLISRVAGALRIPVFGSGDCVHADQVVTRLRESGAAGVLVGRGALRNPWIFTESARTLGGGASRPASPAERGTFLLEYIQLLMTERVGEQPGFRHVAPGSDAGAPARGRERWVVNKLRALGGWYTKGLEGGAELRHAINSTESVEALRDLVSTFFGVEDPATPATSFAGTTHAPLRAADSLAAARSS